MSCVKAATLCVSSMSGIDTRTLTPRCCVTTFVVLATMIISFIILQTSLPLKNNVDVEASQDGDLSPAELSSLLAVTSPPPEDIEVKDTNRARAGITISIYLVIIILIVIYVVFALRAPRKELDPAVAGAHAVYENKSFARV